MKKLISGIIIGGILSTSFLAFADADRWDALKATFKVFVNGSEFISEKPTVAIEGSTYLPLKAIGDVLGVSVEWNGEESRVEVTKPDGVDNPSDSTDFSGLMIKLDRVNAKVGDIVDIYMTASSVPADGINNGDIALQFSTTHLEVLSVTAGDIVTNPEENFDFKFDNEKGTIKMIFADETGRGLEPIKSSGKFAKITVKIKDYGNGSASTQIVQTTTIGAFANSELKSLDYAFVPARIVVSK
jgi:hypothetical protein